MNELLSNWVWLVRRGMPGRWAWLMRRGKPRHRVVRERRREAVPEKVKERSKSRRLEMFLKKVCILKIEVINHSSGDRDTSLVGGVFISKHGLIATCEHFKHPDEKVVNIKARLHGYNSNWIGANIVFDYPQLDLVILRVQGSTAKFRHVKLHSTVNLDWGDRIVSVSHAQTPFSVSRGIAAYPFPKHTQLTELKPLGHRVEDLNVGEQPFPRLLHCKVTGSHYQPDVPAVLVHGSSTGSGASGCPIFKESNKRFIGIQIVGNGRFCHSLPSSMIWKVLKNVVENASSSAGEGTSTDDWSKDLF